MRLSTSLFLLLLLTGRLLAQAPEVAEALPIPDAPQNISVELRCIVLPQAEAVALIRPFRSTRPADRAEGEKHLEELLAKGTAKVVGWPFLTTHAGKKARVDANEEIRYATEFEPPNLSVYLAADENGVLTPQPKQIRATEFAHTATRFDTREVGVTLEAEPELYRDKAVNISFSATHVRLLSIERSTIQRDFVTEQRTEKVTQEQPRFLNIRVGTQLTLDDGEQRIIGIFPLPGPAQEIELFILGVEIHPKK